MPVQIHIELNYSPCCPASFFVPHCATHIQAIIFDVQHINTQLSSTRVNFSNIPLDNLSKKEWVVLYSEKNYADVVALIQQKHEYVDTRYCILSNNCADAIKTILDFCFPENCASYFYQAYQLLLSAPSVLTCGLLTCFPMIPCVTTPRDVFNRAQLLSLHHAVSPEIANLPPDQQMEVHGTLQRIAQLH